MTSGFEKTLFAVEVHENAQFKRPGSRQIAGNTH